MADERHPIVPPFPVLRDLIAWLKAVNVPGMVIGGVAVAIIGRPRVTGDIDCVILLDQDNWGEFITRGSQFGFSPRIQEVLSFAKRHRVLLMRHEAGGIDIDISIGVLPFEQESIERAIWVDVGDFSLPFPTPEDLIIMKAVAHRPIDMADIASILDVHPDVDLKRIRHWVKEFSTALEMPEIYDDLERILTQQKKS